jgi:hypothetical protein
MCSGAYGSRLPATLTVANASGETANFELRVITDATP